MKSVNKDTIRKAFTEQSYAFENDKMGFSKQEYLDYITSKIAPTKNDVVLEMAAGTCACGRTVARYVKNITCLDITPAMLSVGKSESEKMGLTNISFVVGDAAEIPFPNDSFDTVFSRLAFHHFPNTERPFAEMARVLKKGGKLALIDIEAVGAELQHINDKIETLRDCSHIHSLSKSEMTTLFENNGLKIMSYDNITVPKKLDDWLGLTKISRKNKTLITNLIKSEINGGNKTGLYPYIKNGNIYFNHTWAVIVGIKE